MSKELSVFFLMIGAAILAGVLVWLRFIMTEQRLKKMLVTREQNLSQLQQERNDLATKNRRIESEQYENNRLLIHMSEELAKSKVNIRHLEDANESLLKECRILEKVAFERQTKTESPISLKLGA